MRNIASAYLMKQHSLPFCTLSRKTTRGVPLVFSSFDVLETSDMAPLETALEKGLNLSNALCPRPGQSSVHCRAPLHIQNTTVMVRKCNVYRTAAHIYGVGELFGIDSDLLANSPQRRGSQREFSLCEFRSDAPRKKLYSFC